MDTRDSSNSGFAVEVGVTDSIWVVRLHGETDMAAAPEIRETLGTAVSESFTDVVVDLRDVTFLDSMALGALVSGRNRAVEKSTCVRLVVNGGPVTRLLGLTRLDRVFPVHGSLEQALGQVTPPRSVDGNDHPRALP